MSMMPGTPMPIPKRGAEFRYFASNCRMASHMMLMAYSRPKETLVPSVTFSIRVPCSSTAAMRKFVPPRSTPMANLFMDECLGGRCSWTVDSVAHRSPAFFYRAGGNPSILNRCIRAIFDNLSSNGCCVRRAQRGELGFHRPDTAHLHGHKLCAGVGKILLLHQHRRNRRWKSHRARSLRAALPVLRRATCAADRS